MSAGTAFTIANVRMVLLCTPDTFRCVSCGNVTQSLDVQFVTVGENDCDGQVANVMGIQTDVMGILRNVMGIVTKRAECVVFTVVTLSVSE